MQDLHRICRILAELNANLHVLYPTVSPGICETHSTSPKTAMYALATQKYNQNRILSNFTTHHSYLHKITRTYILMCYFALRLYDTVAQLLEVAI